MNSRERADRWIAAQYSFASTECVESLARELGNLYAEGVDFGREQERAATEAEIVAYMRDPARRLEFVMMGPRAIDAIADAIERGEYRKC